MKFDVVITVIDAVSKRTHFILTHTTITAKDVARLFLYYI